MKKHSKLVRSVEMIQDLVVCSVRYWGTLIRFGFIYGFVDAALNALSFLQTTKVLSSISKEGEEHALDHIKKKMPFGKLLSFIWGSLLSSCIAVFFIIGNGLKFPGNIFLLVVCLTSFSIYHTFLVVIVRLHSEKKHSYTGKRLVAYAFVYMIGNPFKSLFILMLTGSAIAIAYLNLVLFVFFVPSVFWLMVQKGIQEKGLNEVKIS